MQATRSFHLSVLRNRKKEKENSQPKIKVQANKSNIIRGESVRTPYQISEKKVKDLTRKESSYKLSLEFAHSLLLIFHASSLRILLIGQHVIGIVRGQSTKEIHEDKRIPSQEVKRNTTAHQGNIQHNA